MECYQVVWYTCYWSCKRKRETNKRVGGVWDERENVAENRKNIGWKSSKFDLKYQSSIQKALQTLRRIIAKKTTSWYIIGKLIKDKEIFRNKKTHYLQKNNYLNDGWLIRKNSQGDNGMIPSNCQKKNQLRVLCPGKIFFKNDSEIKMFN